MTLNGINDMGVKVALFAYHFYDTTLSLCYFNGAYAYVCHMAYAYTLDLVKVSFMSV